MNLDLQFFGSYLDGDGYSKFFSLYIRYYMNDFQQVLHTNKIKTMYFIAEKCQLNQYEVKQDERPLLVQVMKPTKEHTKKAWIQQMF